MTISVREKEWKYPPEVQVDDALVRVAGGSQLIARLLIRRGIRTASEAMSYLDPANYIPTSPMELPNMPKAIMRIKQALEQGEQVTIYGDYDVDGVTGTSVLLSVLRCLGAKVDYYIPHRANEGYGLNLKAVSILASKRRTKLLISCDCGISNFAEINFAKSLGVDTIVADHHSMPELMPPAVAVLHPKQLAEDHPLYHLPGVGVAYKLCEALLIDSGQPEKANELLDYVTLGMIADMVPLVKENRYLVQIGLPRLVGSSRPGIKALLSQVAANGGTDIVGFGLAPRINAVGRLSDATQAVELLTTDDPASAEKLARQLQIENTKRQDLCEKILQEADQVVRSRIDLSKDKAIVVCKPGWHHGVVGIVASRLVEKYHRPVFVGEVDEAENLVKGSARGIDGIDLYAVLKANEHLLLRWGGHKMAAGFSFQGDKLEAVQRAITDTCNRMLSDKPLQPVLEIDALIEASEVSMDLVKLLSRLAPFGIANRKPVLVLGALNCLNTRALGKEGKHVRIVLEEPDSKSTFECVFWNGKGRVPADGTICDAAFTPEINSYNGRERLQLVLSDWRITGAGAGNDAFSDAKSRHASPVVIPDAVRASSGARLDRELSENSTLLVDKNDSLEKPAQPPSAANRVVAATSATVCWKDLRQHDEPEDLLHAAVRKLGRQVTVFAESCPAIPGIAFADRTNLAARANLILWKFPPSTADFQSLVMTSGARNIYLIGGGAPEIEESAQFLRRLLGVVRYAVNHKEGKAEGDKLASALGTTKMSIALGLTIFRKLHVLDWFSEDGFIYLDILDQPAGGAEELPEFRQLKNSLDDIYQFRRWCTEAAIKDIQLTVTPNHIELTASPSSRRKDESDEFEYKEDFRANATGEATSTGSKQD